MSASIGYPRSPGDACLLQQRATGPASVHTVTVAKCALGQMSELTRGTKTVVIQANMVKHDSDRSQQLCMNPVVSPTAVLVLWHVSQSLFLFLTVNDSLQVVPQLCFLAPLPVNLGRPAVVVLFATPALGCCKIAPGSASVPAALGANYAPVRTPQLSRFRSLTSRRDCFRDGRSRALVPDNRWRSPSVAFTKIKTPCKSSSSYRASCRSPSAYRTSACGAAVARAATPGAPPTPRYSSPLAGQLSTAVFCAFVNTASLSDSPVCTVILSGTLPVRVQSARIRTCGG